MLRAIALTVLSILSTVILLVGVQANAANIDSDQANPLILELFATHKECLKNRGFTAEPSVMISDSNELQAGVNTLNGFEVDGLKDFYELYIGGGFLRNSTMIEFLGVVAHELGHLAGDGPRDDSQKTVGEGEADYQSGRLLLPFLLAKPELLKAAIDPSLEAAIAKEFGLQATVTTDLAKIKILTASYRTLLKFDNVKIALRNSFSGKPVPKTLEGYPSTQERWNTVVAGALNLPRPQSWAFAPDFTDTCTSVLKGNSSTSKGNSP